MNIIAKRLMTVPCQPTQRPRGQAPLDRGEGLKSVRGAPPCALGQLQARRSQLWRCPSSHLLDITHTYIAHKPQAQPTPPQAAGPKLVTARIAHAHQHTTSLRNNMLSHRQHAPTVTAPSSPAVIPLLPARCTIGHPSPRRVLRPSSVPPRVLRPTHTRHAATSRSLR
jgi:hypothetical protein